MVKLLYSQTTGLVVALNQREIDAAKPTQTRAKPKAAKRRRPAPTSKTMSSPKPTKAVPPKPAAEVVASRANKLMSDAEARGKTLARPAATAAVFKANPNLHRRYLAEANGQPVASKVPRPGERWIRDWNDALKSAMAGGKSRKDAIRHLVTSKPKVHTRYLAASTYGKTTDAAWHRQFSHLID